MNYDFLGTGLKIPSKLSIHIWRSRSLHIDLPGA